MSIYPPGYMEWGASQGGWDGYHQREQARQDAEFKAALQAQQLKDASQAYSARDMQLRRKDEAEEFQLQREIDRTRPQFSGARYENVAPPPEDGQAAPEDINIEPTIAYAEYQRLQSEAAANKGRDGKGDKTTNDRRIADLSPTHIKLVDESRKQEKKLRDEAKALRENVEWGFGKDGRRSKMDAEADEKEKRADAEKAYQDSIMGYGAPKQREDGDSGESRGTPKEGNKLVVGGKEYRLTDKEKESLRGKTREEINRLVSQMKPVR